MTPILRDTVTWTAWGEHLLLFNPKTRSTLRVSHQDKQWIESLNGTLTLEGLEQTSPDPNHLLTMITRLCRGDFLENSESVFGFLFPKQQFASWAPAKRQWISKTLFEHTIQWPLAISTVSWFILLAIVVFIAGGSVAIFQNLPLDTHPWSIGHDWAWGSFLSYLTISLCWSIGTLLQASMSAVHNPSVTLHLKHTLGILHLSSHRHPIFHTPITTQRQYASVGIAVLLLAMGLSMLAESLWANGVGGSLAVALLLALVWDLCPFFETNGAQLLETVTIHKQRLRTQDFLRSSLFRSPFGEVSGQTGLRITLSIWLVWFGIAIHLLGRFVLPHLGTLLVQTLQYPFLIGQIWLGTLCLIIAFYYAYLLFEGLRLSGNLLEQLVPTKKKHHIGSPTAEAYQGWRAEFPMLPAFEQLSKPELHTFSAGSRLDTQIKSDRLWIVVEGQIAFISPKPEGGFETLFETPTPAVLLNGNLPQKPVLWSVSEASILSIPYQQEDWTTLDKQLSVLQQTQPFDTLPPTWQWILATQTQLIPCTAGTALMQQGERADALYLLLEGTCAVQTQTTSVEIQSPAIIGEMGILSESPRNASVINTTDGLALQIPAHIVRLCLQHHPSLQDWFGNLIQTRLGR